MEAMVVIIIHHIAMVVISTVAITNIKILNKNPSNFIWRDFYLVF
jgi:hypothetical protein